MPKALPLASGDHYALKHYTGLMLYCFLNLESSCFLLQNNTSHSLWPLVTIIPTNIVYMYFYYCIKMEIDIYCVIVKKNKQYMFSLRIQIIFKIQNIGIWKPKWEILKKIMIHEGCIFRCNPNWENLKPKRNAKSTVSYRYLIMQTLELKMFNTPWCMPELSEQNSLVCATWLILFDI